MGSVVEKDVGVAGMENLDALSFDVNEAGGPIES